MREGGYHMKLLVVDDMRSPHIMIENLLKTRGPYFSELLHAYNGQQCVELIRQARPDIVILDMEMPIMNGMDVFRSLPEEEMPLIIVLSAYDKFNYIQHALRYNAFDYLLKPINEDDLIQVLNRAVEKNHIELLNDIRRYVLSEGESDISYRLSCIDRAFLYLSYWKVKDHASVGAPSLGNGLNAETLNIGHSEYLMIHFSTEHAPAELAKYLDGAKDAYAGYQIKINDMILHQASELLDCIAQFRNDSGRLSFYFGEIPDINPSHPTFTYTYHVADNLLERFSAENLPACVDELFDEISMLYRNEVDYNKILYQSFVHLLNYAFSEFPLDFANQSLATNSNAQELKKSFVKVLQSFTRQEPAESAASSASYADVKAAKDYIDEHYMDNFTLDELASAVYMSKFNLCRKFKQHYDIGVWNYIKQVRLNKACELLQATDTKVFLIAEEVGFNDSSYFSNVFRQTYQMSPQAYRKMHRQS